MIFIIFKIVNQILINIFQYKINNKISQINNCFLFFNELNNHH